MMAKIVKYIMTIQRRLTITLIAIFGLINVFVFELWYNGTINELWVASIIELIAILIIFTIVIIVHHRLNKLYDSFVINRARDLLYDLRDMGLSDYDIVEKLKNEMINDLEFINNKEDE